MRKKYVCGIDVGTYHVKVIIAQVHSEGAPPEILGVGSAPSRGMRHGYVVNVQEATASVKKALEIAEAESGTSINKAYISIGGVGLETLHSEGEAIVSRANSEVTDVDTENALADAEERVLSNLTNRKIVHAIPVSYQLDGSNVLGRPTGLRGAKLEVEALFVTALEQHLDDLVHAVEGAGVEVIDIMASPIAASLASTTKQQKVVGCVLANIGAETVSVVVFEENTPLSLKVFPNGGSDITNDIALELRIPLGEAEQLKRGAVIGSSHPQKKVDDIIARQLKAVFALVQAHLREIGKHGLLPAGIIITGGGASIAGIDESARSNLRLPATLAPLRLGDQQLKDATWAVAYGLVTWGASSDSDTVGIENAKAAGVKFLGWFKQFLP